MAWARMIIEGMRTDSLMLMGLRVSQILSAILIVTGITFVLVRRRRQGIPYYQE